MTIPPHEQLLSLRPAPRWGRRHRVWVVNIDNGVPNAVYSSEQLLLEAPNWAPDGTGLLLNGDGLLWRLDLVEPTVG